MIELLIDDDNVDYHVYHDDGYVNGSDDDDNDNDDDDNALVNLKDHDQY